MSLVTTPTECAGCRVRHSAITSAVLPEPTGPPMPTRRGPLRARGWMWEWPRPFGSGCKETHLPGGVVERGQLRTRRAEEWSVELPVDHRHGLLDEVVDERRECDGDRHGIGHVDGEQLRCGAHRGGERTVE